MVPAAVAALVGFLHCVAAGAVVFAALALAFPGVAEAGGPVEALANSTALGLACLRVPLESGLLGGTLAPLSGLVVTLWGLASAVRRTLLRSDAPWRDAAVVGVVFATACSVAAAVAGAAGSPLEGTTTGGEVDTLRASVPGAAVAGLVWGLLAASWALRRPRGKVWTALGPGLAGAGVALGLAVVWFLVAAAVWLEGLSGVPARELGGGGLLAVSLAPNAGAAVTTVGLGGEAELAITGAGKPSTDSMTLWGWIGGTRPWHRFLLILGPLAGATVAGRLAARATPSRPPFHRGLLNGAVLGATVLVAGLLASGTVAADDGLRARAGLAGDAVVVLVALVWGVAGAYLGPALDVPRRSRDEPSRVGRP